jgi:glycosyltransferase involved in cell wall biosynthesis
MGTLLGKIGDESRKSYWLNEEQSQTQAIERLRQRPRILHLVTSFEAGGTERQFVELLKRLDRERYDVRLAAIRKEGAFYEEIAAAYSEVPEFRLTSFYNRNALKQLLRLRHFIKQESIEILHTHGFYDSLFGVIAGRLSDIPVIASQRHLQLSERRVHEWGTKIIHRLAHRLVVNSNAIRDFIIQRGAPAEKIVVIRNGLIEPFIAPTTIDETFSLRDFNKGLNKKEQLQSRHTICSELGLNSDVKMVGMVARLVEVKGHRYLLQAAAQIAQVDPRVHFVLVGDGPLRSEIGKQIAQLGIANRVHLLGDRQDARHLVSAFDVAVLTSLSEGLPNTVMEAMSQGVPVIATAVGGTLELISDNETGFLVPPANAEVLASQILFLLNNEKTRKTVAERGRQFIQSHFNMNRMIHAVESLYDELMTEKK